MDRRLITKTIFACTAMIGLAGCESNGGIRVAGVGDYALGFSEGQEEFSEDFTSDTYAEGDGAGQFMPTQIASFSDNLNGQALLARAGNSPMNAPGTEVLRVANVPAGAAVLLRAALAEGPAPGRTPANLIRPASGIVSAGTTPVVGAIADVAAGAVAPLAPVTAPIVSGVPDVVAGAVAPLAPVTTPIVSGVSDAVAGSVSVVGGAAGVVAGAAGVAGGALASVGETINPSVGQVVNNVPAPVIAGVAGPVAGPVAGTINVAGGAAAAVGGTVNVVPVAVGGVVQEVAAVLPPAPAQSPAPGVMQTVQPTVSDALTPVAGVVGGLLRATR
jgi:hypothetical protein